MVSEVLVDNHSDSLCHDDGVDPVELDRAWGLIRVKAHHVEGGLVALKQRTRGDHLADVETGPLLSAQAPEGSIGDTGHGGKNHRWIHEKTACLQTRHPLIVGRSAFRGEGRTPLGHTVHPLARVTTCQTTRPCAWIRLRPLSPPWPMDAP